MKRPKEGWPIGCLEWFKEREDDRKRMAERIRLFRASCERDEYTDTGDAWALLNEAESALRGAQ